MIPADLRHHLTGASLPLETLSWLKSTFMPTIVTRLASPNIRKRLGIYGGERIPENERNLTDVRNRVSLIFEYELARVATQLLEEAGINDLFWTYVVANRFPDLEVRDDAGNRGLRVEVKCLQSIAEEKSANFDTLIKDIHPLKDFLVVFLWEWAYDATSVQWDRAPQVLKCHVFNCSALAELRDHYWLNKPPSDLGDGLQGFDLRYAVNCRDGVYNEEEGNYGKLLRLWKKDFPHTPPASELSQLTIDDYLRFEKDVFVAGMKSLSYRLLPILGGAEDVTPLPDDKAIGWRAGDSTFFLKSSLKVGRPALKACSPTRWFYEFTDKYAWKEFDTADGNWNLIRKGKKPKLLQSPRPVLPPPVAGQGEN